MPAPEAVGTVAVARSEVRKSLDRLDYHLARGAKGAKGVRREIAYLDALHRQTVRNASNAVGLGTFGARPQDSFGLKAAEALRTGQGKSIGRMKSSVLADFSADGLHPARFMAGTPALPTWTWQANASACPTCLVRHGNPYSGQFVPSHPSCLCIPVSTPIAKAYGVEKLSEGQVREAVETWGDPRYLKQFEKMDNGLIDFSDIAKIEDVNSHTAGLQAFKNHLAKNEITLGELPTLSSQELAQTFPYGSPATATPQPPVPSGTTSKAARPDWLDEWLDDDAVRLGIHDRQALVRHSDEWWEGMGLEGRDAVKEYSQSFFQWENEYRLARSRGLSEKAALEATRLKAPSSLTARALNDEALDKLLLKLHRHLDDAMRWGDDLDSPIITHRRIRKTEGTDKFIEDLEAAIVSGEKVSHVPYASTTIDPHFALGQGSNYYQLEFLSKSGRFIGYHSAYPKELEWLIRGGTEFRVRGKKTIQYLRVSDGDMDFYILRHGGKQGKVWDGATKLDMETAILDAKSKGVALDDKGAVREHIAKMLDDFPESQVDEYMVETQQVYQLEEVL